MINLADYHTAGFDRGAPAWKEGLWWIVRSLLFAPAFPLPSRLKASALRAFGAEVGAGVVLRSKINITAPWRLKIGDHVWIGDEVLILSLAPVTIGSHTCISQRAFLCTGSHDFSRTSFDLITRPIEIGRSCWIGSQCFVGPGVRFGDGSRSLAGSVVVKSVPLEATVSGVPARTADSQAKPTLLPT